MARSMGSTQLQCTASKKNEKEEEEAWKCNFIDLSVLLLTYYRFSGFGSQIEVSTDFSL